MQSSMKNIFLLLILFVIFSAAVYAQEMSSIEYMQQGNAQYISGDFNAAKESFEAAIRLEPNGALYWRLLGNTNFELGNYTAAIENFGKALQLYGNNSQRRIVEERVKVHTKRAEVYINIGNYDAAIADYSQAIRLEDKNPLYWNNRGEAYRKKGDYSRAVEDYLKAIELNPEYANAYNSLGLAYFGSGSYDKAIECFTKAVSLDSNHILALNNRGGVYSEIGEYDKAIADFTNIIDSKKEHDLVYSNRGRAYIGKKDYQKALADFSSALKINPKFAPAISNRARAYLEMGDTKQALASFKECLDVAEQSINMNDISVYAWYLAGMVYEKYPYLNEDINRDSFWKEFASTVVLDAIERGIKNAENIRQNMGTQGAELMTQMIYLYYAGVDFEIKFGTAEKAFLYSESLRSRGFLEQVGAEAAIRLKGITDIQRDHFYLLRAIIERQNAIISTYDETELEGEAIEKFAASVMLRKQAETALAELDKEISAKVPNYMELRNPKPVTLKQAMEYCGKDRAVLEYVLWDPSVYKPIKGYESWELKGGAPAINSYCLVIDINKIMAVSLDSRFDYNSEIRGIRRYFDTKTNFGKRDYEKSVILLYDFLIKPVLPYLIKIKNITIVPDGNLAIVPFDILKRNDRAKDFGKSYALSLSPSISVSILAGKDDSLSYNPVLFFANDTFAGKTYLNGRKWNDLRGVKDEIEMLQNLVSKENISYTAYFRENATNNNLQKLSRNSELKKFRIIHFACHGEYNAKNPTESGLVVFHDGETGNITIPDIAVLEINSRIVILSACETGLIQAQVGDGMVGLIRAFMVAGGGNAGVSLWEIDDKTTSFFMNSLYGMVLKKGISFKKAYYEVKDQFRKGKYGKDYKDPFYWAAFVIYE